MKYVYLVEYNFTKTQIMKHKQSPNCKPPSVNNTLANRLLQLLYISDQDKWNLSAFLSLISGIITIQVLVSLVFYPILNAILFDYNIIFSAFIFGHILLVPLYLKFGLAFTNYIFNR